MVCVKHEMVQIEEPQPMFLRCDGMATNGIELVNCPNNEDDVETDGRVVEILGHNGFHSNE